MVKIVIENLEQRVIPANDPSKNLLTQILEEGTDWMHDCGGKGRCTSCKAIVVEGMENISPLSPAEKRYRQEGLLGLYERLCCQVRIKGSIRIRVAEEFKLGHVRYSD